MGSLALTGFPGENVEKAVRSSVRSLFQDLNDRAPRVASLIDEWTQQVYGDKGVAIAFLDPESYPLVHFPVWADPSIPQDLLDDLTKSSIAGYLWVRLIDDVMDGDRGGLESDLLPLLGFFHLHFSEPYRIHFEVTHPFWELLTDAWIKSGEAAVLDHYLTERDPQNFREITARKTRAAIIPVSAALYARGSTEMLEPWSSFIDAFNLWHQLQNDLFDWRRDLHHDNPTLLITEGRRHADTTAELEQWFWSRGLSWAAEQLATSEVEVRRLAGEIGNADLNDYIHWRFSEMQSRLDYIQGGLAETRRLRDIFGRSES